MKHAYTILLSWMGFLAVSILIKLTPGYFHKGSKGILNLLNTPALNDYLRWIFGGLDTARLRYIPNLPYKRERLIMQGFRNMIVARRVKLLSEFRRLGCMVAHCS